ncbi:hypothetical protein BV898_19652 [Hypsibius exemplaris]|uniref:Uncharacterized protein n=1 Tax=Hypsibius exemplaris TaxID=2072580 RepID=A0A9X6RPZ6_HYPEX|nr:hypothetical protein BV898_19652 [Hypsibius exemplaris]
MPAWKRYDVTSRQFRSDSGKRKIRCHSIPEPELSPRAFAPCRIVPLCRPRTRGCARRPKLVERRVVPNGRTSENAERKSTPAGTATRTRTVLNRKVYESPSREER